ncbi:RNA 2',3'-cyclic phosphodiesterase [Nocardiopsis ansamitocini]|uniref:RNA 2',3'-cyclic phosphodiesterase n=1 Tax=Nocardiopsis ansamitocini TaxID=1670832 RepID=A0A9W6P5I0_9ACTN|nr:RNA 2',3'-cyclic phosphodiesterase [Nocardiopsis ansamitocini]GLU47443.1 RNA 2',3'-cyclic phosphodiesterase [Nocardiopsis ansamitocini]
MRLFAAVVPPPPVCDELRRALVPVRERAPEGLRWSPREQWHVTLLYLGEVPEERVAALRWELERSLTLHKRCVLGLAGAGTFPGDAGAARVLWAGLTGETGALAGMADGIRAAAAAAGVEAGEERDYVPHLTLARAGAPTDLSRTRADLAGPVGTEWTADQVHLVHSRPGHTPRYHTVASWGLA